MQPTLTSVSVGTNQASSQPVGSLVLIHDDCEN